MPGESLSFVDVSAKGRHSIFHVEIFFCCFITQKSLLYAYLSHKLFILKGIRTFIFCKLFGRDIRKEKLEEIGVEGSDNMFMINTVDDNFDEN